jgi:hypothetical protein
MMMKFGSDEEKESIRSSDGREAGNWLRRGK